MTFVQQTGQQITQATDTRAMLCRLLKLLKISNLTQLTAPFEASFGSAQVSFARLVFFFFMIFHATACGFHLLTLINDEGESWIDGEEYDPSEIWSRCRLLFASVLHRHAIDSPEAELSPKP